MGKIIKKGLSYLLTVAMVLGLFTWGPLAPAESVREAKAAVKIPETNLNNLTDAVQYHGINDAEHTAIGIKKYKRSGCYGSVYGYELKLKGTQRKLFGGTSNYDIMTSYWGLYGSAAKLGTSVSGGKALDVTKETSLGSNVSVKMTFTGMQNANIIRVGYEIKNAGSSAQKVSVGGTVDTDIAGDDYAKIETFESGNSEGLISTARGGEYISFSIDKGEGANQNGYYWYGKWTSSEKNDSTFASFIQKAYLCHGKDPNLSARDGSYDSCMSWLWTEVNVPAGKTVTKYCYWGVGDLTEGDDPKEIETAAAPATVVWDANADGDTVTGLPINGRSATDNDYYVALPEPARNGYKFDGWYDQAAGGNKITGDPEHGNKYKTEENIILYAHWTAIVSKVNVKLLMGSDPFTGQTVQLYLDGRVKHSLTESESTPGTYSVDRVVNGKYDVAVNGVFTGDKVNVAATKQESTWTTTVTVKLAHAKVNTKLDGQLSNVPGVVTLCQNGKAVGTLRNAKEEGTDKDGVWETGILIGNSANASFDIYVGGVNTGKKLTSSKLEETVEFYTVKVEITDDTPWDTANVTLRDSNGKAVASLPYDQSASQGNVTVYSKILQKSDTECIVDVGGINTGKTIKVGATNDNTINLTFYTATLNVTCSDASGLPMQATMTGDGRSYAFKKGTPAGGSVTYTVEHVLVAMTSGSAYTVKTTGVSTEGLNQTVTINSENKTRNIDVKVVNFKEYTQSTSDDSKYTVGDSGIKEYVISGGTVKGTELYLSGYTFDDWSKDPWTDNDQKPVVNTPYAHFDFTQGITEDTTLYPHYLPPTVKINGIVRTNASGVEVPQGSDTAYRLGNLSITGFEKGEQAIRYVIFSGEHITKIEAKNQRAMGATYDETAGILEFSPLVSMAKAQEYVRNNIIITPDKAADTGLPIDGTITVTVIDKNGTISSGTPVSPARDNTQAEKLTGSTSGKSLDSGFYYVESNISYTNSTAGGSGITINGTVYIYIKSGCTLTAKGANASGQTGGGAGINVSYGKTLYLLGEGSVVATGGNAANGSAGTAGSGSSFNASDDKVYLGAGGKGGAGGGGAGAGIGTAGGSGGDGGAGGQGWSVDKDHKDTSKGPDGKATTAYRGYNQGYDGSDGAQGFAAGTAGTMYILLSSGKCTATSGSAGTSGGSGGANGGNGRTNKDDAERCYSGGAGGGGGGAGYAGQGIGAGGNGGSGGGGGASAGYVFKKCYIGGGAGAGGAGNSSGTGGTNGYEGIYDDGDYEDVDKHAVAPSGQTGGQGAIYHTKNSDKKEDKGFGGNGGNGGSKKDNGGNGTKYTQGTVSKSFTISTKAGSHGGTAGTPDPTSYDYGSETLITLPHFTVPDDTYFFRGWKLTTYGVELGSETGNPLTSGAGTIYAPGKTFTTTKTMAGKLEFTAETSRRTGLFASDTAVYNATKMKTYTVTTKVGGQAKNVGQLTFTYTDGSGNPVSVSVTGLNGVYTFATVATEVKVALGTEEVATMTTTEENPTAETTKSFESVKVTVTGYKPSDVTLDNGGPVLTRVSEDDKNKVYVYESPYRVVASDKGDFPIRVDGTTVGKNTKYGENTTVAYHTLTVKLAPSKARNVILKDRYGNQLVTEKVGDGPSNTFVYTTLEDKNTKYDVYADGTLTGATGIKLDSTREIEASYYLTKVTVKLNDNASDVVGNPYYGTELMMKGGVGIYSYASADGTARDVTLTGVVAKKNVAPGSEVDLNYYSITYERNETVESDTPETGNVPAPTYCLSGGIAHLAACPIRKGVQRFAGWTIDGMTYSAGSEISISAPTVAKPAWQKISLNELDKNGKGVTVIFDKAVFGYNSTSQTPDIKVYYGTYTNDDEIPEGAQIGDDRLLTVDRDYVVTYKNDNPATEAGGDTVRAGTVTVFIAGTGSYSGVVTKTYQILPRLVHLRGITATKVFDGTTSGVNLNHDRAVLDGKIDGDSLNYDRDKIEGYVDSAGIEKDEDGNNISKPLRIRIQGQTNPDNIDGLLTGDMKSDYALAGNITAANGEDIMVDMQQKSIMPTEISVYDKTYDDTTEATIIKGSIKFDERFVSADVAKSFFISGNANFNNASVGKGKSVTITNMVLIGADGKPELNYKLTNSTAGSDIVKPAEIVKASQLAPAPGEGYRLENESIIIDSGTSSRETKYQIHWVNPKADEGEPKEGLVEAGESIAITEGIDYYIRWDGNVNYQPSSYTKVITYIPAGKEIASLPEAVKGLVYDGILKTGVIGGKGFTLSGDIQARFASGYIATATLQDGYLWPDGTGDDEETRTRDVKWVIAKSPQEAPAVRVDKDPYDASENPADVFIYPDDEISNPTSGQAYVLIDDQAYKTIEYSTDGGRSWQTLPKNNGEKPGVFRNPDRGVTYLFRYAGDVNHEPSPAKEVVMGDKLYTPVTKAPTDIESTGAILTAEIEQIKDGDILGFSYREKGKGDWITITDVTKSTGDGGPIQFSRGLTTLTDGKFYEYKAFIQCGPDKIEGKVLTFKTGEAADGSISVSITVQNPDNPDAKLDVLVTVEKGNDPIDSRGCKSSQNAPGSVKFTGLQKGHYNVVVRTSDFTETKMLSVSNTDQNVSTVFTIPIGKLQTIVDIGNDAPKAAVEGLDGILTKDDRDQAAVGAKDVEVRLEVKNAVEKQTGPGDTEMEQETQQGIREIKGLAATAKADIRQFIDMNLFKETKSLNLDGSVDTKDVQNIGKTNTKVIEIAIPISLRGILQVLMFRYHDGVSKALTPLEQRATPGVYEDGTYYVDREAEYIFVYASGFSTFAICTTGGGGNPGGGSSGGGGGGVVDPDDPVEPDKEPKTEERASNIIPVKNGVEGYGAVEIYSLTSKENTELSGAVFALYNEEGEEVGRGSTLDGYMRFINVGKGTYTYREILAPEGYKLLGKEGRVTITDTKKEVVIYILHAAEDQPGEPEEETKALTIEDILSLLTDAEREIIKDLMARYGIDEMEAIRFYMQTRMYGVTEDCMNITPDMITSRTTDKDIEGSEFGKLRARSKKSSKKKIALKWTKVGFADGYMVFGSKCNVKGKKFKQKLFTTTNDNETLSYNVKKLKKGTYYKFTVIAYKNLGSGKVTTAVSKVVHMATKGGKFTNPKKIKLKSKKSIKIREKRLKKTKARVIPMKKRKKLPAHRALSYESSDKSIATVTWNGRIVGVSKGTCKVFVYAQNGIYKVIKVKVTP